MYRGHVHRFIFLFICVHTDVRFDPLFCIMAMWHGNFCTTLLSYIHIYNIKQGSNLYTCIYGWLDLVVQIFTHVYIFSLSCFHGVLLSNVDLHNYEKCIHFLSCFDCVLVSKVDLWCTSKTSAIFLV